jgi:8-oxo-dGTP diphosphatase
MSQYRSPHLTVDIIIQLHGFPHQILLVKRKYPPDGWAIPGGFVEYGETVEAAAVREALEETSLRIELARQFHVYSDPGRDPRKHTVSVVFIAAAQGTPVAGDDAASVQLFGRGTLPSLIAFDHRQILRDYFDGRF